MTVADPITSVLGPKRPSKLKVRADIRRLERRKQQTLDAYQSDIPGEKRAAKDAAEQYDLEIRRTELRARGRKIDLVALVALRSANGSPLWSVANPFGAVADGYDGRCYGDTYGGTSMNGVYTPRKSSGVGYAEIPAGIAVSSRYHHTPEGRGSHVAVIPCDHGDKVLIPSAIPPLPKKARTIAEQAHKDERVKWVGVLYQPSEWLERKPDPAIVVEYMDLPGEYYALAVWGGDRARIMEFVD